MHSSAHRVMCSLYLLIFEQILKVQQYNPVMVKSFITQICSVHMLHSIPAIARMHFMRALCCHMLVCLHVFLNVRVCVCVCDSTHVHVIVLLSLCIVMAGDISGGYSVQSQQDTATGEELEIL